MKFLLFKPRILNRRIILFISFFLILFRVSGQNYYSDKPKNLTVVYLIPSDLDTIAKFKQRLGPVMFYAQDWFRNQMNQNGFGNKTFGILKDTVLKQIPIHVIRSANDKTYLNNAGNAVSEVNQYFTNNPGTKTSEHVLILMPPYFYQNNDSTKPNAGPFYGYGKYCFAMDCKYMDTIYKGTNAFALWVGGMMHEIGHAFQLPHNSLNYPTCGDFTKNPAYNALNFPGYKPSLMSIGNYTLELYNTILTKADCAILNVNQIFNNSNSVFYENVNSGLKSIHGVYHSSTDEMEISGRFFNKALSGQPLYPIDDIVIYNDPNYNNEGTGVNRDYNAISWLTKPIGTDSFNIRIPKNNLQFLGNTKYELKVKLVHSNGKIKQTVTNFEFRNNRPVLSYHMRYDRSAIDRKNWIITTSSVQPGDNIAYLIDSNVTTFWHSNYQTNPPTGYPHTITIQLPTEKTILGFSYNQRDELTRAIKDAEILISADGVNYQSIANLVFKNAEGFEYVELPSPLSFKYFQIKAKSSWDGQPFAALAEINLYEEKFVEAPCQCQSSNNMY